MQASQKLSNWQPRWQSSLYLYRIKYTHTRVWVYLHILGCNTYPPSKTSPVSVRKQDYLSFTRQGPDFSLRHKDQVFQLSISNTRFCFSGRIWLVMNNYLCFLLSAPWYICATPQLKGYERIKPNPG